MRRNDSIARFLARWLWLVLVAVGAAHADRTVRYTVQELSSLGGVGASARGINNRGDVVGTAILRGLPDIVQHAVLWTRDGVRDLGPNLGDTSLVSAINDHGFMVGDVGVQPFLWSPNGTPTPLPFAGRVRTLNNHNTIAGSFFISGVFNFGQEHAMFFQDGVLHDLGFPPGYRQSAAAGVNGHGVVVGSGIPNFTSDNHALIWQNGVVRDLGGLGGHNAFAGLINDRGDIVGTAETATGRLMLVRWHVEGGMEVLGERLSALAMNERGDIVGNNLNTGKAFLLRDGTFTSLSDATESAGYTSFAPFAMNDRGQVAGVAFKPGGSNFGVALLLTPKD
ncbi:MAG TPA: hypothetical protein VFJ62_15610 [Usitatibacter sp.]|nr:hypothetical protein [Usitatibacter sp.]